MHRNYSSALVTQKESSVSSERLFLNWNASFTNFYSTNFNVVLVQVFFCLLKISEAVKIDLFVCSMVAKDVELFHGFHLFAILRFIRNINNLFKAKSTCTTNYVSDIIFLSDVMKEEISLGKLFFHFFCFYK